MYYTYIIYSDSNNQYYVGYTHNLKLRIERHNLDWSQSTKSGIQWRLVYHEEYPAKSEAMSREREIKKWKSRKLIEKLIVES
jgi:putative endonuclease